MRYAEVLPSARLRGVVECFWSIDSGGAPAPEGTGEITPDGGIEVVLELGDGVAHGSALYSEFVVGQLQRATSVAYRGAVDLLAIRFRPAGAHHFVEGPVDELSRRLLPLDDVLRRLTQTVDPAWPAEKRIAAIEAHLLRMLDAARRADAVVDEAARLIESMHGRISVSWLMSQFSLSARQLERRFLRAVGLPPKTLCRVLRFRHAAEAIQAGPLAALSDVAAEAGYCDESHMIRDFVELAGRTPSTFLRDAG